MAEIISYPANGADDLYYDPGFPSMNTALFKWNHPAGEGHNFSMVRFPNITTASGTVLASATLTYYKQTVSDTDNTVIKCCISDNAVAPTTVGECAALSWSDVSSVTRAFPGVVDVLAPVQEIVNRGGFVSGNAIMLGLWIGSQGPLLNSAYSFDDGVAGYYPKLILNEAVITVVSFTPASGDMGAQVTISGSDFSTTPSNNTVKFNGTAATVVSSTATSIVAYVPVGATTGKITVDRTGYIQEISATNFIVTYMPKTTMIR
jgi:hypothetical protein